MRTIVNLNRGRTGGDAPRGSALVEAALVIALFFVPMLFGVAVVGLNLLRVSQANQINRDAGHIFARKVDLSATTGGMQNRTALYALAPRLRTTGASGTAVLILSYVSYIAPSTCTSCPFVCTNCANLGHVAFIQQIVVGNSALKSSYFGTVPTGSFDTNYPGSGKVADPYGNTAIRADAVSTHFTFGTGDGDPKDVYISETYLTSADLAIPGFTSPPGTYVQAFF